MELPTLEEIAGDPRRCLARLRDVRCDLEVAERAAIASAVEQGCSLVVIAADLGVSRQAVSQRMQRAGSARRLTP